MTRALGDPTITRSLALHREVAERIRQDPALLEQARKRVHRWIADGSVAREYAEAWRAVLEHPTEDILRLLTTESEQAHDLRQVSPFAGALDPRTRWRILRALRTETMR